MPIGEPKSLGSIIKAKTACDFRKLRRFFADKKMFSGRRSRPVRCKNKVTMT